MASCKRPRAPSPLLGMSCDGMYTVVVAKLNQAVTSTQRLCAVSDIFRQLRYDFATRTYAGQHEFLESLVKAGAVNALCLQLGYVLNKYSPEEELEYLCRAIDLIYRCPDTVRELSIREIGADLFTLLTKAIGRAKGKNTIREIVSIWYSCSSSSTGAITLMRCHGLVSAVVKVLVGDEDTTCTDTKTEALGLVKNLTFYAEDHRLLILEHPGMLASLTRMPYAPLGDKALGRLSAIFRNLAVAPSARLIMAQQPDFLSALVRMCSNVNRRSIRNILSTVVSLAMEADSCVLMILHGDGILLSVLARLVLEDSDKVVRRRAARALRFLARDRASTLIMGNTMVMDALFQSALHDACRDVRDEAAEAFANCAAVVQAQMPHHRTILDGLMNLATGGAITPDVVARALKEQAVHPSNRIPMGNHVGLLSVLAGIALSETSSLVVREDATCALCNLSAEESNRERMASKNVLVALVRNALERHDDSNTVRQHAVSALVNLASVDSNRKRMVTHTGLLRALVQFAANAPDSPTKSEVKKVILMLVPFL